MRRCLGAELSAAIVLAAAVIGVPAYAQIPDQNRPARAGVARVEFVLPSGEVWQYASATVLSSDGYVLINHHTLVETADGQWPGRMIFRMPVETGGGAEIEVITLSDYTVLHDAEELDLALVKLNVPADRRAIFARPHLSYADGENVLPVEGSQVTTYSYFDRDRQQFTAWLFEFSDEVMPAWDVFEAPIIVPFEEAGFANLTVSSLLTTTGGTLLEEGDSGVPILVDGKLVGVHIGGAFLEESAGELDAVETNVSVPLYYMNALFGLGDDEFEHPTRGYRLPAEFEAKLTAGIDPFLGRKMDMLANMRGASEMVFANAVGFAGRLAASHPHLQPGFASLTQTEGLPLAQQLIAVDASRRFAGSEPIVAGDRFPEDQPNQPDPMRYLHQRFFASPEGVILRHVGHVRPVIVDMEWHSDETRTNLLWSVSDPLGHLAFRFHQDPTLYTSNVNHPGEGAVNYFGSVTLTEDIYRTALDILVEFREALAANVDQAALAADPGDARLVAESELAQLDELIRLMFYTEHGSELAPRYLKIAHGPEFADVAGLEPAFSQELARLHFGRRRLGASDVDVVRALHEGRLKPLRRQKLTTLGRAEVTQAIHRAALHVNAAKLRYNPTTLLRIAAIETAGWH